MSVKIFLSTVSDEFRVYRDQLRTDLTRHNVEVKVQEDFKDLGRGTLDELDTYIDNCDAVVHLVGHMTGAAPEEGDVSALLAKYPDLTDNLPPLGKALKNGGGVSYTQWEAWLALYHRKELFITQAKESAERGPRYAPTDVSRAAQTEHQNRLRELKRYSGFAFTSPLPLWSYAHVLPYFRRQEALYGCCAPRAGARGRRGRWLIRSSMRGAGTRRNCALRPTCVRAPSSMPLRRCLCRVVG
jgi:choline dehydrogenase-like flavoprotein